MPSHGSNNGATHNSANVSSSSPPSSSNAIAVYHQQQHWIVPKSPVTVNNGGDLSTWRSTVPSAASTVSSNSSPTALPPSCLVTSSSNVNKIRKVPSTPTFKQSASVIYEEEYEIVDQDIDTEMNDLNTRRGICLTIGRSGGESEDSTSQSQLNTAQYFHLSPVPSARKRMNGDRCSAPQRNGKVVNDDNCIHDNSAGAVESRDDDTPPIPPHREASILSTAASFTSTSNINNKLQCNQQAAGKTFYRSYTREESIFDHSSQVSSAQRKLYHHRKKHLHHHHRTRARSDTHSIRTTASSLRERVSDSLDGMSFVLSALYAKLLVIIGLCFPMAEVISRRIPIGWYEGFYLYLYMGSILYLSITYALRVAGKKRERKLSNYNRNNNNSSSRSVTRRHSTSSSILGTLSSWMCWTSMSSLHSNTYPDDADDIMSQITNGNHHVSSPESPSKLLSSASVIGVDDVYMKQQHAKRFSRRTSIDTSSDSVVIDEVISSAHPVHFGSFYLRLGAVAFGIGSMIYSGLEFGQFFELESKEHCHNFLYGFTPSIHMAFTFFQLYFIFMNSQILIMKHKFLARFGLMHMIATNLCVWLHVLIQETKHQIMIVVNPNGTTVPTIEIELINKWAHVDSVVEDLSEDYFDSFVNKDYMSTTSSPVTVAPSAVPHAAFKRSIGDHESVTHGHCRRTNVIGQLVQDASQFLFPCTIEYSLICAAILYMMWKHTEIDRHKSNTNERSKSRSGGAVSGGAASTLTVDQYQHHKYHYQVDCAKAHKGLFCGLFLLVVCIISLILFFVLIKKPNYRHIGVLQAHIVELLIYVINSIACILAASQIRQLRYNKHRNVELDNILLIVAQAGLYIFNMFSLIGAQFYGTSKNTQLVLINAIACIAQATLQTIFILDASRRYCNTAEQTRAKPGREMVTFMLVCNFSMWAINTLETRRAESNPVQLSFFGFWAWNIITHVTTPLTIFYRFHSTVCLCDIWKRVYKLKSEFN